MLRQYIAYQLMLLQQRRAWCSHARTCIGRTQASPRACLPSSVLLVFYTDQSLAGARFARAFRVSMVMHGHLFGGSRPSNVWSASSPHFFRRSTDQIHHFNSFSKRSAVAGYCWFVWLLFNGTFSTNRLYRATVTYLGFQKGGTPSIPFSSLPIPPFHSPPLR